MAKVTREQIVEVFGSVAPDYSDIPAETWQQVVSSLYGMEKREFDAFVDELEAQSKQRGTPDIRRSLVKIYDNAKRDVRATPEAQGRSEAEITEATNRVFSNIRRVVRDPAMLDEVGEKGLVQWSRDNAGTQAAWAEGPTFRTGIEAPEAAGMSGLYGDPREMRMPLEPLSVDFTQLDPGPTDYTQYLERAAAREAMADNRPIEEEFFSETEEVVPAAGPGGWMAPLGDANRSPEWFQGDADTWMALTPQQRRRAAALQGPAPVEGAIGGVPSGRAALRQAPAGVADEVVATETVSGPGGTEVTVEEGEGRLIEAGPDLDELARDPTLGDGRGATWMLGGRGGSTDVDRAPGLAGDRGAQPAPAEPEGGGMSGASLAGAIVGGAGIAAAIGNTIADFRTTRDLEKQLAASAAGDTIARREGALGGAQARRNIMATSLGRRDISPALALRNAQMTGSRAMSDIYGRAAVESARERRESERQLAELRKRRWNTLFSGLTQAGSTVGSFLTAEGAAQTGAAKRGAGGGNGGR